MAVVEVFGAASGESSATGSHNQLTGVAEAYAIAAGSTAYTESIGTSAGRGYCFGSSGTRVLRGTSRAGSSASARSRYATARGTAVGKSSVIARPVVVSSGRSSGSSLVTARPALCAAGGSTGEASAASIPGYQAGSGISAGTGAASGSGRIDRVFIENKVDAYSVRTTQTSFFVITQRV